LTDDVYIIRAFSGAENQYSSTTNVLLFDPNATITNKKGYKEHPTFTLGHELEHAWDDYRGKYTSKGYNEANAVNAENYYRTVWGHNKYRRDYDFGFGDWITGGSDKEAFKNNLFTDEAVIGERVKFTGRKVLSDFKLDSKDTYVVSTVGVYNADSEEVKNQKTGIIYFFDFQKDKNSKIEKKAVIINVSYANKEKK
jgi:hypothetical protein